MIAVKIFIYVMIYLLGVLIFTLIAMRTNRKRILTSKDKHDLMCGILTWPLSIPFLGLLFIICSPIVLIEQAIDKLAEKLF